MHFSQPKQAWSRAFIGLGSNLGDRQANILEAVSRLGALPEVFDVRLSPLYLSEPQGFFEKTLSNAENNLQEHTLFLNGVASLALNTDKMSPQEFLKRLLDLETHLGRSRHPDKKTSDKIRQEPSFESRKIDLDLLLYDDRVISEDFLTLPHPRMHLRAFVLVPLSDLDKKLQLPPDNMPVSSYLEKISFEICGSIIFQPK